MRRVRIEVWDDLDWARDGTLTAAEQVITIGLNGTWAELDVSRESQELITGVLGQWIKAGHPLDSEEQADVHPYQPRKVIPRESIEFGKALRQFAREHGLSYTTPSGGYYYGVELRKAYAKHLQATGRNTP